MTRIISGTARGRRLTVPRSGTRPTSDRVREAVFSTLDSELLAAGRSWPEVGVLDLYAGTGALGLEALSRGAREAVLVERSRAAARVLAANADVVGCEGARVLIRDVMHLADVPAPTRGADLVFADPPYDVGAADLGSALADLLAAGWIAPGALVVVERPTRDAVAPCPADWPEPRRRPYGDTTLWYGRAVSSADTFADDEEGR
jgi:16S rRNA (guanine966-N2)-methyltransferase